MILSKVAKALAKQEAKREKKMARKKEWDELYYRSLAMLCCAAPYNQFYRQGNQKRARRTQL